MQVEIPITMLDPWSMCPALEIILTAQEPGVSSGHHAERP